MILLPVQWIWYVIICISMVLVYLYMLEAFDLKHFDNDSLVYCFRQLKLQDVFYVLPFSNEYFGVSSKIFTIFNLKNPIFLWNVSNFKQKSLIQREICPLGMENFNFKYVASLKEM